MLNLGTNHRNLVLLSFWGYLILSTFIALIPAKQMNDAQPLPGMKDLTAQERKGLEVFVSENCMACHTQQVRSIEMDKMWGNRPSIPSDYYYTKKRMDFWRQSPSLLGSERTGPDLTNIGKRQTSVDWHMLHLFNPRLVVKESVMPSYIWLFNEKDSLTISGDDIVLNVPDSYLKDKKNKVVASTKAKNLVAFLLSLKQVDITDGSNVEFIPALAKKDGKSSGDGGDSSGGLDGADLYMQTCSQCHQADGKGLPGAFPPLAGSATVNDGDYRKMASIILNGYDALPGYGIMPPQGHLSDDEIAAIMNHERSSWGNDAPPVTAEQIKEVRDSTSNKQ